MDGRKPATRRAIVKKRTGPLFSDEVLTELNARPTSSQPTSTLTPPTTAAYSTQQQPNVHSRRIPSVKDKKDKKRERWLLTRKTWKYMADAGRKLIPDGAQNRPEDIQKCERHFHNLCANEPRFILWRRKASYPGAVGASRNSKRRLKLLLSHSHKGIGSFDFETEEARNADQVIDLLSSYLKLDESRKITTLLGSKTVRPDQTSSPSAQRPGGGSSASRGGLSSQSMAMSSRGPGFLPPLAHPPKGINALSEIDQLLERLRTLSRSSTCRTIIPLERITPEILEDKVLLKQIYNELKKQQLHRIIGKHSSSTGPRASLPHASSLSSLWHFRRDGSTKGSFSGKPNFLPHFGLKSPPSSTHSTSPPPLSPGHEYNKRVPPSSLDLPAPLSSTLQFQTPPAHVISVIKKPSPRVMVTYATCGTQTNFIQLNEIERLAKEYKEMKQEEAAAAANAATAGQPTDDESDKGATAGQGHRRKSSIDNEDVSQSVSDTIKRYLRMARKKSVHDDNANRFKRVNYDRNLRNIRAKGEINPPGMDDGCNKAIQTLDAWPVISLDFIRGHENNGALEEAHLDWRKSLDQRIQQKQEYENKMKLQQQHDDATAVPATVPKAKQYATNSSSSSSAPTSPTNASHGHGAVPTASGILHSSTQFLSNLWHGTGSHHPDRISSGQDYGYPLPGSNTNSTGSIMSVGTTASGHSYNSKGDNSAMQKSKSSSNVGQFVSKKIFKTRSKSQTRTSSPTKAEWTPQGNCTWTSDNGRQVTLTNSHLQNLTEIEAKILQRVAIEKINQLNIGVSVAVPSDSDSMAKAQKRRPLAKKKAMTTSFFDIGRKEDKGSNISIFGNTLEDCVANDLKRRTNLTAVSDRGSRNSITSLFRGGSSSKVRSCESLPSGTYNIPHSDTNSSNSGSNIDRTSSGNGNLVKTAAMLMSRSQSDVRRSSQDFDELQLNNNSILSGSAGAGAPPPMTTGGITNGEQADRQVPTFVQECIKHLEKYGLHSVGLFRVSTSKKRVRQMREELDRSSSTFIDPETCPHDVATLLKEFLRDLPEPLLCRNLYKAFIKTQKIRNRRLQLEAISHLVQLLPTAHRDTLFVLLRFLAKVASCCDDIVPSDGSSNIVAGNKMDSNNLATVFAPNILRSSLPGEENNEQESMGDVINVIRTMIDHYEELFRVQAELMDEIYANMIDTFPEQLNYLCERRNISDKFSYEEIDSGGSNTPLNSPPPTGVMKTSSDDVLRGTGSQQTQYQFNNELPPDSRTHSESSYSSAASRVPPIPTSRRIYTREDVMHGNAVSKGDPPQDGIRRSKSKHPESDTQQQRLLSSSSSSIKYKSGNNSDSSNTPSTTTTAVSISKSSSTAKVEFHSMHHQQQQQQQPILSSTTISPASTISARRLSSPYVLDRTGVVTASLKIPVQMQQTTTTTTTTLGSTSSNSGSVGGGGAGAASARDIHDDDEVFYRGSGQFDLSNIPYIEDSTTYGNELGNCIEGFQITGSLLFGGGGVSTGTGTVTASADGRQHPSSSASSRPGGGAQIYQIPIAYEMSSSGPGGEPTSKLASFLSSSPTTSPQQSLTASKSREKKTIMLSSSTILQQKQQQTTSTKSQQHLPQAQQPPPQIGSDNQAGHMEQRLPTSISNIGGAILRSKTADFERMAAAPTSASAAQPIPSSAAASTDRPDRGTRNLTPGPSESPLPRGQLYKRQELISSAKRK
ncbi:uncharacterized protein LOC129920507 isoform X2 [Episyrphus balteatus]|uniref:uncharacterized protein LOC129920507 isoform X2 n=1 Tax=Episyrphus balteatus TaxID=286459 RepID=UPI002486AB8F|nr:uncharacterized protein LOC129920507 isoform X2 [Episyrphus balteatus]